jgi:prepilin-type N-terminal cleavage/methylation domain-containing protein/prepilin-type processing-associated H-X9-DG protein
MYSQILRTPPRRAFTLIELLVVIAIIAILIALLVPAVQKVRESANMVQCKNNLKQLGLACHSYHDVKKGFPLLYSSSSQLGWMTQILPYIEQTPLYNQYNFNVTWYDARNLNVISVIIPTMVCPTSPVPHLFTATDTAFTAASDPGGTPDTTFTAASTDYFAFSSASSSKTAGYYAPNAYPAASGLDLSGAFGAQSSTPASFPITSIIDGTSNTMMIGEMSGRPWLYVSGYQKILSTTSPLPTYVTSFGDSADNIPLNYGFGSWAQNNNFGVGTWSANGMANNLTTGGPCAINCSNYRGVYSFHPAGANAAFADGSVHMLGATMSPIAFFALVTARAGDEVTDLSALY